MWFLDLESFLRHLFAFLCFIFLQNSISPVHIWRYFKIGFADTSGGDFLLDRWTGSGVWCFYVFLSAAYSYKHKRISVCTVIFLMSIAMYIFLYNTVLKYLFSLYTPHISFDHPHKYTDIFKFSPLYLINSGKILFHAISNYFYSMYFLIFVLFVALYLSIKMKKFEALAIFVLTFLFSLLLATLMQQSHGSIYKYKILRDSIYFAPAVYLVVSALLFLLSSCSAYTTSNLHMVHSPIFRCSSSTIES